METHIDINTVDQYNSLVGQQTFHPLVSIVDLSKADYSMMPSTAAYHYGIYAIWLKNTRCGDITYGRQPYDYQEGTVVSYAPGQVVHVKRDRDFVPNALGLLFHPDLIRGTSLGQNIRQYSFFDYSSREALHLSDQEKEIYKDCLDKIRTEIERPIDNHSKRIICRNIELLLDYCMRFYERQFITRKSVNMDMLTRFEAELDRYFDGDNTHVDGLPSVRYFAEKCFLSPNYFGDLVKKETGHTPQEIIQQKIIDLSKEELLSTRKTVSEIAYTLGFQYSQHFNRYFKRNVGLTPSEYRRTHADGAATA